jgi:hypothetical protein
LLHHAERNDMIQGIRICNGAPSVSHLLFADDSLILMKATSSNASCLREVLELYEACYGQQINKEKSSIMFSKNTKVRVHGILKEILEVQSETVNERYLEFRFILTDRKKKLSNI